MADQRQHRGPHPEDARLFAAEFHDSLRRAVGDLAWLLTRGYALPSSLKLVGDRYGLSQRQRIAVQRSSCSDQQLSHRQAREIPWHRLSGCHVWIDGFNLLTTIEAALAGGVLLLGRDGCLRDMASMHGSYRKVAETLPALDQIGRCLSGWGVAAAHWLLDAPVSNSGRLKTLIETVAAGQGWHWTVELAPDPDRRLIGTDVVVITADSAVLDGCRHWSNAARGIVAALPAPPSVVDLS